MQAAGAILAGRSLATAFAKVVLRRLLAAVTAACPALPIRNAFDNASALGLGMTAFVSDELGRSAVTLADGFTKLQLVLSGRKSKYIASRRQPSTELAKQWSRFGSKHKQHVKPHRR